jgi:hypothetical protein
LRFDQDKLHTVVKLLERNEFFAIFAILEVSADFLVKITGHDGQVETLDVIIIDVEVELTQIYALHCALITEESIFEHSICLHTPQRRDA